MENNIDKMDELREQFQLLTDKISSQEVDNEQMLKSAIKRKFSWIDKVVYMEIVMLIPSILGFSYFYFADFVSLPMYICIIIFVMADVILDYKVNRVKGNDWMNEDLLSTRQRLIKMNSVRRKKFLVEVPLGVLLMAYFAYQVVLKSVVGETMVGSIMIWCIYIISMSLAVYYSIRLYKKMQRTNEELIREIEKYQE